MGILSSSPYFPAILFRRRSIGGLHVLRADMIRTTSNFDIDPSKTPLWRWNRLTHAASVFPDPGTALMSRIRELPVGAKTRSSWFTHPPL